MSSRSPFSFSTRLSYGSCLQEYYWVAASQSVHNIMCLSCRGWWRRSKARSLRRMQWSDYLGTCSLPSMYVRVFPYSTLLASHSRDSQLILLFLL